MLHRRSLSLAEAQRGVNALVEHATAHGHHMAIAVVDDRGDFICGARMDGAPVRAMRLAMRKAYTAAVMGKDTASFKQQLHDDTRTLADYGDPLFTTLHGGTAVLVDGEVVGAIGVAGNSPAQDAEIARLALQALGVYAP